MNRKANQNQNPVVAVAVAEAPEEKVTHQEGECWWPNEDDKTRIAMKISGVERVLTVVEGQNTLLQEFKNVKFRLPSPTGLVPKKSHFIATIEAEKVVPKFIPCHYNVSNMKQNNGKHTIAKNFYMEKCPLGYTETELKAYFKRLKNPTFMPLGREALGKIKVFLKVNVDANQIEQESIIIDHYIYNDQTAHYEEYTIWEGNVKQDANSIAIPDSNQFINFKYHVSAKAFIKAKKG